MHNLNILASALFAQAGQGFIDWMRTNPTAVLLAIALVVLAFVLLYKLKANAASPNFTETQFRHHVAETVLKSAIWGTVAVTIVAILSQDERGERTLTLLLPVFGTWVGTLLAYYFGKDNFEAGAKASTDMAERLTGTERLRKIRVTEVMIPVSSIVMPVLVKGKTRAEIEKVALKALEAAMTEQRLPLIDSATGEVFAVLHQSLIYKFLVKHPDKDTIKGLLDDPEAGNVAKNTFVVLDNTKTLADVKEQMTQQSAKVKVTCEDAFITPPDSKKVEGWITNDIIAEHSKVSA